MKHHWNNEVIMFQGLVALKSKERKGIVNAIYEEIGHFSE
jgi:hypothetical protein